MKKMRGGAGLNPGFNQAVDFIINCGNEVLVSKNKEVTGNDTEYTLIGTFASSSILNRDIIGNKVPSSETKAVELDITSANKSVEISPTLLESFKNKTLNLEEVKLHLLTPPTAFLLLKKDLAEKNKNINLQNLSILENNLISVDNKFHYVKDDVRLANCNNKPLPCTVVTQLFKVKVDESQKNLFPTPFEWKKYDDKAIFSGHRTLLLENANLFTSSM